MSALAKIGLRLWRIISGPPNWCQCAKPTVINDGIGPTFCANQYCYLPIKRRRVDG